jgi:hypothetical protein
MLVIFTPPPGTPALDKLSLLRGLNHDEFAAADPARR